MTNINCSENCTYSINGKCTLNQVSLGTSLLSLLENCAYYIPKETKKKNFSKL